jgi:hypothetical protein
MDNTHSLGDPLVLVSGLLAIGWIFYAAIAQSRIRALQGTVKFLEDENAALRKKRSN